MSGPQIERLARKLHLLDLLVRRRYGPCPATWSECNEEQREEWRTLARDTVRAYAAQAAREN